MKNMLKLILFSTLKLNLHVSNALKVFYIFVKHLKE